LAIVLIAQFATVLGFAAAKLPDFAAEQAKVAANQRDQRGNA
jgi:hypothetical protein